MCSTCSSPGKSWRACHHHGFNQVDGSYMLLGNITCLFHVLATQSEGILPLLQHKTILDVGYQLNGEKGVDTFALDCSTSDDDALSGVMYPHV